MFEQEIQQLSDELAASMPSILAKASQIIGRDVDSRSLNGILGGKGRTHGAVVGVAFSEPMSKGDYDEMGYGIAYPIEVFYGMLKNPSSMKVTFVDAIEK